MNNGTNMEDGQHVNIEKKKRGTTNRKKGKREHGKMANNWKMEKWRTGNTNKGKTGNREEGKQRQNMEKWKNGKRGTNAGNRETCKNEKH